MRTSRRAATTLVRLALCVLPLAAAAPASAAEVPSGWSWTNYGPELLSVGCVDPLTCVAVGQGGAVLRSPNTDDVPLRWTFVELERDPDPLFADEPVDLVGVTCTDTSCLAVSNTPTPRLGFGSWVYRSTDAGISWTAEQQLPPVGARKTASGTAIACTPAPADADGHDCYVAGVDGGIWRSTDDGRTWKGIPLPAAASGGASFDELACAGAGACVAAGGDTSPSSVLVEGTKVTALATPTGIDKRFAGLACDRADRCVGTGGIGLYTLLDVDRATWGKVRDFRVNKPKGLVVDAMSCPLEDVCVGLTDSGIALRTTDLGAPSQSWQRRPIPATIGALDCETSAGCVAVGKAASWFASFDVGSGFGRVNQVGKFDLAQCSATLSPTCVGAGKSQVGVSRTGGELWTLPLDDRSALNANTINCTELSTCQILGQTDNLFTTDFDAWRARYPAVQSAAGSDDQTCVTATLCVGVSEGTAYTTFDGGVTPWLQNPGPPVRPSAGIACLPGRTNPVTCLVPAKDLILIGTMTQDAAGLPHWRWRYTDADSDEIISAVACDPTGAQCTAVGAGGTVLTTTGANGLVDWRSQVIPADVTIDKLPDYTSATCPQAGFCLAGGKHGAQSIVASTVNGWADWSYDEIGDIRAQVGVAGFGCESVDRCVAVGSTVLVGVRNPPIAPPPAR